MTTGGGAGLPPPGQGPPQGQGPPPISLATGGLTAPIVRDLPIRADNLAKSLVRGDPAADQPNHHPGPPKPEPSHHQD